MDQGPAHQELEREVVDALGVGLVVGALGAEPALHQAVAHRVGQGLVDVEVAGGVLVLGDRVHHPVREGLEDARLVQPARRR